jgi:hypothetical protein
MWVGVNMPRHDVYDSLVPFRDWMKHASSFAMRRSTNGGGAWAWESDTKMRVRADGWVASMDAPPNNVLFGAEATMFVPAPNGNVISRPGAPPYRPGDAVVVLWEGDGGRGGPLNIEQHRSWRGCFGLYMPQIYIYYEITIVQHTRFYRCYRIMGERLHLTPMC